MAKKKEWMTHDGLAVPESAISPFDKEKEPKFDAMLRKALAAKKAEDDCEQYLRKTGDMLIARVFANRGKDIADNESYTLYNYDKSIRLVARKNVKIELSADVNVAMKIFNEYLDEVMKESPEVRRLIQQAFSTTNGELDPKRLIRLLNIGINHPKWIEACNVLKSSLNTNTTSRYIKLAIRNEKGEYEDVW